MDVRKKLGAALGALTLAVLAVGFVAMPAAATPAGHPLPADSCTPTGR